MIPQTFIFIGRSGCGKGTQADLLRHHLETLPAPRPVLSFETGELFRKFIEGESITQVRARDIARRGERQPDFLAVWMWVGVLVEQTTGEEHIIIDGAPRALHEAHMLDSALSFYGRIPAWVIYLDVSRTWAEKRLRARGREDDQSEREIKKRLDWFETDVEPALKHLKESAAYRFITVSGEQSVEEVHERIKDAVRNYGSTEAAQREN